MSDNSVHNERREARRRRRIRNQILAHLTVILFIALVGGGAFFAVQQISGFTAAKTEEKEEKQSMVEEILNSEEEIVLEESGTEESIEPVVEKTEEEKLDEIANACIEVMPLEDRVAGLFFVTPEAITGVDVAVKAGDGTKEALAQYAVGGIIYSKKNMQSNSQFAEMVENTKLYSKYPLFLATVEEGGSNSTLVAAGLADAVDGASKIAETGDISIAYDTATAIATYMAQYQLNVNMAPVADLKSEGNGIYNSQSYGADKDVVLPYVNAMQSAMKAQKITACVKHFPGMGTLTDNPSEKIAVTERTLEEFEANEFELFRGIIENGANMIMVSNGAAPALTGDNTPCSLSKELVTGYLRTSLGYDGVIITEAMNEKAVSEYHGSDEAAIQALKAGCDMILMPEDFQTAYQGVLQAVKDGTISEERINDSLRRIYRIKYADKIEVVSE